MDDESTKSPIGFLKVTVVSHVPVYDLEHFDATSLAEAAVNLSEWYDDGDGDVAADVFDNMKSRTVVPLELDENTRDTSADADSERATTAHLDKRMSFTLPDGRVSVPPTRYTRLYEAAQLLSALEAGGVDNWDGYGADGMLDGVSKRVRNEVKRLGLPSDDDDDRE